MNSIILTTIICTIFTVRNLAQNYAFPQKIIIKNPDSIQYGVKKLNENTKEMLNFKNLQHSNIKFDCFQPKILSSNFSYQYQGWFCKFEYRMRQKTAIPLYIRLGSKELTDHLEGKNR
jgi:hypothetical protein